MIEIYVNDIKKALSNGCCFSALSLALTLPDICGMAEFPNKQVAERYIGWYDKYISDYMKKEEPASQNPYLSGEMVYNLRNTYLHQGSPNVVTSKVKEEINQVDKFVLYLGDGKMIHEITIAISAGPVSFRTIMVDISFLCDTLCECSLQYYRENKEKFEFDFNIIPQNYLFGEQNSHDGISMDEDPIGEIVTQKLSIATGQSLKISGNVTQDMIALFSKALTRYAQTQNNQEAVSERDSKIAVAKKVPDKKTAMVTRSKKELQFRSFFGQTFKEKKYQDKKEQIIESFLSSKTKTQLNGKLTKIFQGQDVKVILNRLKPKIKDWPGQ